MTEVTESNSFAVSTHSIITMATCLFSKAIQNNTPTSSNRSENHYLEMTYKKGNYGSLKAYFAIVTMLLALYTIWILKDNSRNYCLWLTTYSITLFASIMAAFDPKHTGKTQNYIHKNPSIYLFKKLYRSCGMDILVHNVNGTEFIHDYGLFHTLDKGHGGSPRKSINFCPS